MKNVLNIGKLLIAVIGALAIVKLNLPMVSFIVLVAVLVIYSVIVHKIIKKKENA